MAECTDPKNQNIGGAFPNKQTTNSGEIKVNFEADPNSIFNPNLVLSALQTYNTFNNIANKIFGIEARWFRAIPQQRSKDVIFKEYTLSCVEEEPICIKVVLPDGNFPDSKYQYDLMGLEYEIPLEIHIDKKYWEELAGFGTAPQKKDIVYLPMPNKLYDVESAFLKRGFMEQETTWVVNLIKHQKEVSRKESEALTETIDNYTVSEQELFGEAIQSDIDKLKDDKQMSAFSSTEKDKYKELDTTLKILPYTFDIYGIVVAESVYDLNTCTSTNAIEYKNSRETISKTNDRAVTAWFISRSDNIRENNVVSIQENLFLVSPANYEIKITPSQRYKVGNVFEISRPGSLNFYATVISDSSANEGIYYCKIDEDVETYLTSIKSNWVNAGNYKAKLKDPINIINGINDASTGFKIDVYANQYIKITYGSQEHVAVMNNKLDSDKWYGIVANIGNSWGQYNVYLWKQSFTDIQNKLENIFYKTLKFTPESTIVEKYIINKSYSYITNIRLFKNTIEEENQISELLSYFTQNADQALILDNCDIKFTAPYISRQR